MTRHARTKIEWETTKPKGKEFDMKRWMAAGLLFVFAATLAFSFALHSPVRAKDTICCTMPWKPCPLGGYEIGSWKYFPEEQIWVCGHWNTVCDTYCLIP